MYYLCDENKIKLIVFKLLKSGEKGSLGLIESSKRQQEVALHPLLP